MSQKQKGNKRVHHETNTPTLKLCMPGEVFGNWQVELNLCVNIIHCLPGLYDHGQYVSFGKKLFPENDINLMMAIRPNMFYVTVSASGSKLKGRPVQVVVATDDHSI